LIGYGRSCESGTARNEEYAVGVSTLLLFLYISHSLSAIGKKSENRESEERLIVIARIGMKMSFSVEKKQAERKVRGRLERTENYIYKHYPCFTNIF